MPSTFTLKSLTFFGFFLFSAITLTAQVTTSELTGRIVDEDDEPLIGATVLAVHEPSGTNYGVVTNLEGRYNLPGLRPGGPYTITVSYIGYTSKQVTDVELALGSTVVIDVDLSAGVELETIEVVSARSDEFANKRKGTATNINTQTINAVPTISRNFTNLAALTPQAGPGGSFGGQDNRLNNITVDGSVLNSSFGLSGTPGGRTGTAAISLDAVEEVQVNVAPYDVRQAGFVGAAVNAVTRSGTNDIEGSVFYFTRNQNLVGTNAAGNEVTTDNFLNNKFGFRLGGPIIKDKLFFFVNAEGEQESEPAQWTANSGNEPIEGTKTRVLASDLDRVSQALSDAYGYNTGPYEGYDLELDAWKFLAKLNYNISPQHKVSLRYNGLVSDIDRYISNSRSLGFGNRRTRADALSYKNSNYVQTETIHSVIGEWNALFSNKVSNKLIAGWTYQNEDRDQANAFPLVEMQQDGLTYISTGTDPFTPKNSLQYTTFQVQNNTSIYSGNHTITAGFSIETFSFENLFFPGSFGVFAYNSVDDFLTDIQGDLDNPNRDTSTVDLLRYQFRYSALPGGADPVAKTNVFYGGIYGQDEWQVNDRLDLVLGLRFDVPIFGNTALENPTVSQQTYQLDGEPIQINTGKLPNPQVLISPRFGFNYKIGERSQLRGGSGLFAGRPAFVWISNQVSNNGVLSGFEEFNDTRERPFTTDPIRFIDDPSAGIPSTFQIDISDENLRFPQVWRSNLALDVGLPWGLIGTLEFIYNSDVNSFRLRNINQAEPSGGTITGGPDNRPLFADADRRINGNTTSALYLASDGQARSFNFTTQLEKPFDNGLFFRLAYNYGNSQNLIDLGSTTGSWFGVNTVRGNNNLGLSFTDNDRRHRVLGVVNYRIEYGNNFGTEFGLVLNSSNQTRFDYVVNGDINNDGIRDNDLLYVPNDADELRFEEFTRNGVTFTEQMQRDAFNAYIDQDDYLSGIRGQYSERNGAQRPMVTTLDLSVMQEFFVEVGGQRNTLQVRLDIINFTNMLNNNWGVGNLVNQSRPLQFREFNASGEPVYRMATFGDDLLRETFRTGAGLGDVWQMQLGFRYIFGR